MADQPDKAPDAVPLSDGAIGEDEPSSPSGADRADRNADRGLSDFVRRAVSAGVGAASRSKDEVMRAAASEMRTWLDRLDVNNEVLKALSKMVIEIKTEIRFRPTDDGRVTPETSNDVKIKPAP